MGLPEILSALEEAGHAEETEILQAAAARAASLAAAAREEVDRERSRLRALADATTREERARRESEAQLRVATTRASARDALVRHAFERARDALKTARSAPSYPTTLRALLAEALEQMPTDGSMLVRCDVADRQLALAFTKGRERRVSLGPALPCWGGCVVQDADGSVVVDNTLERRLERAEEVLWPRVAMAILASAAEEKPGAPRGTEPEALATANAR